MKLLKNIRFYIITSSISVSLLVFFYIQNAIESEQLRIIRLTQIYGVSAFVLLYLALLAGPLCFTFRFLPFRGAYLQARRALGISSWYFALLHGFLAFFKQLGGFAGLPFLSNTYIVAISLSGTAFLIMTCMAATSFDVIIKKITYPRWKLLHRFIYLGGIFVVLHALLLGTHYTKLSEPIPQISFALLALLFFLEALRLDAFLRKKFSFPALGPISTLITCVLALFYFVAIQPLSSGQSGLQIGIHAAHLELSQEIQKSGINLPNLTNIPGLDGDPRIRYSVNFNYPEKITPQTETPLRFEVYNAQSGERISLFKTPYEKTLHLIIVDAPLVYFSHEHPIQDERGFALSTSFPHPGTYHLYLNFQPWGGIEQQFALTLKVLGNSTDALPERDSTTAQKVTVHGYTSEITTQTIKADDISAGTQSIIFKISDAHSQAPITSLQPYLAAFGHLTMINVDTYEFAHVHPKAQSPQIARARGGPTIEFLPLGLYAPIRRGVYRLFGEFNPNGTLITVPYTIRVE